MIASYNEIYGDDSYAQDSAKMAESLERMVDQLDIMNFYLS